MDDKQSLVQGEQLLLDVGDVALGDEVLGGVVPDDEALDDEALDGEVLGDVAPDDEVLDGGDGGDRGHERKLRQSVPFPTREITFSYVLLVG